MDAIPHELLGLLEELTKKSLAPFNNESGEPRGTHDLPAVSEQDPDGMFPSLPQLVKRGRYAQDTHRLSADDCAKASSCTKPHASLTPGLFSLHCVHGMYICPYSMNEL